MCRQMQRRPAGKGHGALRDILQLPYVTRPVRELQCRHQLLGYLSYLFIPPAGELIHEEPVLSLDVISAIMREVQAAL
jgi:hypothetical protein